MTMVRGQFNIKLFKGALDRVFWKGYDTLPAMYPQLFNVQSSNQAEEQMLRMVGFGALRRKYELGRISEEEFASEKEFRFIHLDYALGLRISRNFIKDEKYGQIQRAVNLFARSATVCNETLASSIFNNAFSSSYPWQSSLSEALIQIHTLNDGVTTSTNLLATPADFSAESLPLMATTARAIKNPEGILFPQRWTTLLGAPSNEYIFKEVLRSSDRPDTAERATNVMKGMFTDMTWDYLTDADAWFLLADKPERELWWFDREKLNTASEAIPGTGGDMFYYAQQRNSCGVSGWEWICGTPGAG